MAILEAKTPKQEELVDIVKGFVIGEKVLELPALSEEFNERMYEISLTVDAFHDGFQEIIEVLKQQSAANGAEVKCKKGCAPCCSHPIGGALPEGILIVEYLKQNPSERNLFLSKYRGWRSRIEPQQYSQAMQQRMEEMVSGNGNSRVNIDEFYGGRVPCAFLEDEVCSIYEARPIVCRQCMSILDPKECVKGVNCSINPELELYAREKSITLFNALLEELDIPIFIQTLIPLFSFEFLMHGKKHIDCYVEQAREYQQGMAQQQGTL